MPVAASSKALVCDCSLVGIAGSNPAEGVNDTLLRTLCVFKQRSLRRADHPSREFFVWSWNLNNKRHWPTGGCHTAKKLKQRRYLSQQEMVQRAAGCEGKRERSDRAGRWKNTDCFGFCWPCVLACVPVLVCVLMGEMFIVQAQFNMHLSSNCELHSSVPTRLQFLPQLCSCSSTHKRPHFGAPLHARSTMHSPHIYSHSVSSIVPLIQC